MQKNWRELSKNMKKKNDYSNQVFINCPFDKEYIKIFQAIVFAVLDCRFVPRCSWEVDDATEFRLRAIVKLIKQCKYGIHDLSRVELDVKTKLPRFNMPFELGIFYGAKFFGGNRDQSKNCIVLEKNKYRYHKFISDLSGVDVTDYNNSIRKVIIAIRNWLMTASRRRTIPEGSMVYSRYQKFQFDFLKACKTQRIDGDTMPFIELTHNVADWRKINRRGHRPLFS